MKKILIILRHEFLTIVTKPSFWIGLLVVPLITGVIFGVIALGSIAAAAATSARKSAEIPKPQGYVDLSKIVNASYISGTTPLQSFAGPADAQVALNAGQISGYYLVPQDFLATGEVKFVSNAFSPFEDMNKTSDFRRVLELSLLAGDSALLQRVQNPVDVQTRTSMAPAEQQRNVLDGFSPLPFAVCLLFFMVLITASSYLMSTVSTEKENRVMEVLMSSVSPVQLLTGKILGLGILGLIQLALWLVSGLTVLQNPIVASYVGPISNSAVATSVVFFVFGYLIYAALMAGLGALMPGTKEASQYVFFVMLPLLIPLYLNSAIANEPNGTLATVLSLVPFTSPVVMPMRLVSGEVPPLQILAGIALLIVAVLVTIWLVARVFRAQALLSGSKASLKSLVAALKN